MTQNRVRSRGSYAPLSANYYNDDAVMRAGEKAEVVFTRGLAFCAGHLTDGFISDLQLTNIIGRGMRDAKARAERLCAADLWIRDDDAEGYWVASWLNWNQSKEVIAEKMRADAARKAAGPR